MAKISARGAHEVGRVKAVSASKTPYLYVMCSDGRVLVKWDHPHEGYTIFRNRVPTKNRNIEYLVEMIGRVTTMTDIRKVPTPARAGHMADGPGYAKDHK